VTGVEAALELVEETAAAKVGTGSSGLTVGVEVSVPADADVTLKTSVPTSEASTVAVSAEIPHLPQQAALFDRGPLGAAPLLPVIYTPVGEHMIIRLSTPLDCVILDTEDLSLCRQPATLVSGWCRMSATGHCGHCGRSVRGV